MADFTIRTLRPDEIELLLDQLEAIAEERRWIASEPPIPRDRWRGGFEREREDEYSTVLVAVDEDDRLIGHLSASGRQDRPAEIGMAVSKEWRGRGVGTALMQARVDWAHRHDVHKLWDAIVMGLVL